VPYQDREGRGPVRPNDHVVHLQQSIGLIRHFSPCVFHPFPGPALDLQEAADVIILEPSEMLIDHQQDFPHLAQMRLDMAIAVSGVRRGERASSGRGDVAAIGLDLSQDPTEAVYGRVQILRGRQDSFYFFPYITRRPVPELGGGGGDIIDRQGNIPGIYLQGGGAAASILEMIRLIDNKDPE